MISISAFQEAWYLGFVLAEQEVRDCPFVMEGDGYLEGGRIACVFDEEIEQFHIS